MKKEIALFAFSWIKTFTSSFLIFIKYFWWLLGITATLEYALISSTYPQLTLFFMILIGLASMFSIYLSTLAIRSSVGKKDFLYFVTHLTHVIDFTFVYVFGMTLLGLIIYFTTGISPQNWPLSSVGTSIINIPLQAFMALILLNAASFLVDTADTTHGIGKALYCSAKGVCMYIVPFLALVLLYTGAQLLFSFIFSFTPLLIQILASYILRFFFACSVGVLYLKIRYCHHRLFFN